MTNSKNTIDFGEIVNSNDKTEVNETKHDTNLETLPMNKFFSQKDNNQTNNKKHNTNNDTDEIENYYIKANTMELFGKESQEEVNRDVNNTGKTLKHRVNSINNDGFYYAISRMDVSNHTTNSTNNNITVPKRYKKYDYYNDEIKTIEFVDDVKETDGNYLVFKTDKGYFDQQNSLNANDYSYDSNAYKTVPKINTDAEKTKSISEKDLIKVIIMLTKTFKMITKYHDEIKEIYERLVNENEYFAKNMDTIKEKFKEFDEKYFMITKSEEKLKEFDSYLKSKEDYFKKKQEEISKSIMNFQNQQKKFLSQQQNFYVIQKFLLAQNQKINIKQNLIAKMQSKIAHRQNNFARILKKSKQIYLDSTNNVTKLHLNVSKPEYGTEKFVITTATPITESVKINLFSIPVNTNKVKINDDIIIKEKDDQLIDDLVYKYYFNNTFIGNLMKSKFLTNVNAPDQVFKRSKNKRAHQDSTLLLPINIPKDNNRPKRSIIIDDIRKENDSQVKSKTIANNESSDSNRTKMVDNIKISYSSLNDGEKQANLLQLPARFKRRISHISKKNHKHDNKLNYLMKSQINNMNKINVHLKGNNTIKAFKNNASKDPFLKMATKFCIEIGKNFTKQELSWCVEKTLRRLQIMSK